MTTVQHVTVQAPTGRVTHVPGEPALWGVLLGDILVFTILFVVFLLKRAGEPVVFAQSRATLNEDLAAANTLVLLTSSLLVVFALRAFRAGDRRTSPRLLLGAIGLGLTFIGIKAVEYAELLTHGHTPSVNDSYMWYFVLTGLHLAHVVVALVVLTVLHWVSRQPGAITPGRLAVFEGGACFWHMVDLLWIVIFPLLFLVR
jgi:nitric oxide reductase NorE protein